MDKVINTTENDSKKDTIILPKLAGLIEQTYSSFGITTRVVEVNYLAKNIEFYLEVALGNSINEIVNHSKDIAMALASPTGKIEIEAPVPGKSLIAVRVPYTKDWIKSQKKSFNKVIVKNDKENKEKPLSVRQVFAACFYLIATGFGKIGNLINDKK